VRLWPATLYGWLRTSGAAGRRVLAAEIERLEELVRAARAKRRAMNPEMAS
jgi:hypothetical protein